MLFFEKKLKKDQINYLSAIKLLLQNHQAISNTEKTKNFIEIDELIAKLDELSQKVYNLEEKLGSEKKDSVRKAKVKEHILSLLQQHKKLSSSQLSNIIGLSRTRCNEYLRELSIEGLTEGIIVGRQKFYKLIRR